MRVVANKAMPTGGHQVEVVYSLHGGDHGSASIYVDGSEVGTGPVSDSLGRLWRASGPVGKLLVGRDRWIADLRRLSSAVPVHGSDSRDHHWFPRNPYFRPARGDPGRTPTRLSACDPMDAKGPSTPSDGNSTELESRWSSQWSCQAAAIEDMVGVPLVWGPGCPAIAPPALPRAGGLTFYGVLGFDGTIARTVRHLSPPYRRWPRLVRCARGSATCAACTSPTRPGNVYGTVAVDKDEHRPDRHPRRRIGAGAHHGKVRRIRWVPRRRPAISPDTWPYSVVSKIDRNN
jgi:hypothetical protein